MQNYLYNTTGAVALDRASAKFDSSASPLLASTRFGAAPQVFAVDFRTALGGGLM